MILTPRFVELSPLLLAGMREPLSEQSPHTIPVLWQKFAPYIGHIPHQQDAGAYGLCVRSNASSNGDYYYMAACGVSEFADLPAALSPLIIPACRYAVFIHEQHVTHIKDTIDWVFEQWLPASGCTHNAQSIHFFERYGADFCPDVGVGGIEVWLPVK